MNKNIEVYFQATDTEKSEFEDSCTTSIIEDNDAIVMVIAPVINNITIVSHIWKE